MPIEGNSLWFVLVANSFEATMGRGLEPGGLHEVPPFDDQRSVTLLYEPEPAESNNASVRYTLSKKGLAGLRSTHIYWRSSKKTVETLEPQPASAVHVTPPSVDLPHVKSI